MSILSKGDVVALNSRILTLEIANDLVETTFALYDENERLKRDQLGWSREALEHAKAMEAENARLREEVTQHYDESISARCFRTQFQCCHICERLDCCDNTSEWAKKYKALRAVVDAARALLDKMNTSSEEVPLTLAPRAYALKAALEKVEGK